MFSAAGLRKGERLAQRAGVDVRRVHGDAARYCRTDSIDFVFSCGAIHYVPRRNRGPACWRGMKA